MSPPKEQTLRDGHRYRRLLRELRRALLWHRRLVAAVLAAAAVASGLAAVRPPPAKTVTVVTTTRDLPAGTHIAASDIRSAEFSGAIPAGALTEPAAIAGRTTAGPVRRGELLTDVRLLGARLLDGYGQDLVATPVRIADPATATLLQVGDKVDVLAAPVADAPGGAARLVATATPVISVPVPDPASGGLAALDSTPLAEGALLVLATTRAVAADLAAAAASARLSITLRPD
jgi:Flp pilus assembly protein CpaB